MGELIRWEAASKPQPFSGERLTAAVSGHQVEIEHYHRYLLARDFCRDRDVLDVASGEGYGTALLAQVARSAIGIEVDALTVAAARSEFRRSNLRYERGDARALPISDASIDVAVSFETLEHILEHEGFVAEIRRVLRPGGRLIMSTPDRDIYSPVGAPPNPYHVLELTRAEFEALLRRHFAHVVFAAQRAFIGSLTIGAAQEIAPRAFERRGVTHIEASDDLPRAPYMIALASDSDLPALPNSIYVHRSDLDTDMDLRARAEARMRAVEAEKAAAEQQAAEAVRQSHGVTSQLERAENVIAALQRQATAEATERAARESNHRSTLSLKDAEIAALQTELAKSEERRAVSEERLAAVLYSTSWRLTRLPRRLGSRHPTLARYVRRGLKLIYYTLTLNRFGRKMRCAKPEPGTLPSSGTEQRQPDRAAGDIGAAPTFWFFIGDTIEWLQGHKQLTGVGRVTVELFSAFLDCESACHSSCVLADGGNELVAVPHSDVASYLTARIGTPSKFGVAHAASKPAPSNVLASSVRGGDHVLFTGVVWTNTYQSLFQTLSEQGIFFSVLVHDIIPIESPHLVDDQVSKVFADWLETVVTLASVVFVSSPVIKDQILNWAALSGIGVRARIEPIKFGSAPIEPQRPYRDPEANPAMTQVELSSFVLSVGTIDTRKNQALLCRLWQKMVSDLGDTNVPQLVLAGRDELNIFHLDEGTAALVQARKIVVLQGLSDPELAGLYRACLFTVFPSLSEGYGLPVAESLQYGKLCVCSDLPVIREHAGSLPWYFDPGDEAGALAVLQKAISDDKARATTEIQTTRAHQTCSWASAYQAISAATAERLSHKTLDLISIDLKRPAVPGLPALVLSAALAKSQKWCTNIDPAVSIIIINWNATRLTFECVRQIWANTDDLHFEIIIVDNGSRPEQVRPLKSLGRGVRVMELGANRFFGEANNIAAETAKGRHLCFLNNDAFVRPGWLRSLVDVLDQAPDAGAVGPLFLFPDNTIQEAGAVMDERGYPVRLGRGSTLDAVEFLVPKTVDYVSAAMLLVSRELFLAVGGFDLAYEPAYYEDVDLCFKIRAFGKRVYYCPDAQVVHVEGSAVNGDPVAIARRTALGDLNRDKFTARWGAYLESRSTSDLVRIGHALKVHDRSPMSIPDGAKITAGAKTAAIFTPFLLTPGGGERYLLTLASAMTADYAVTLVTPHQYSSLRLLQLGREFSIDLSSCAITTEECFLSGPCPDLMVTLGSHIIPSIAARSRNSLYVCQFPFHLSLEEIRANKGLLAGYRAIVTYSEYVKTHVLAQLSAHQLPSMSVEVVHPPVPPMVGDGNAKRRVILSVGRFYVGGHNKRHDTMIRAFRAVLERLGSGVELHLAGSSMPMPEHMDHLNRLRELADGLPVVFHVNASPEKLSELYRDAAIYWHGTGLEADLERHPEEAEHFGITIVEAMAAECVVLAFNSGGPREVVTHGVDGFLYGSMEELLNLTLGILEDRCEDRRKAIGTAARARASTFFPHHFVRRVRELAAQPVERIPERAED